MNSFSAFAVLLLLGINGVAAQGSGDSVFTFARCPQECSTDISKVFDVCADLEQFGCTIRPCAHPGVGFQCTKGDEVPEEVTVLPGDRLVFQSINVADEISFFINFTAVPLKTDFYFLTDATGSMATAITAVREQFSDLVDAFSDRPDVGFGVGIYRDETELDNGFQNLQSITTNVGSAKTAIRSIVGNGGGDTEEANLVALFKVATESKIGWRSRSRKILVYVGDQPGHEATCFDGITLRRQQVINALKELGVTVIAVSFKLRGTGGLNAATKSFGCPGSVVNTAGGQATDITRETNGALVQSNNQAEVVPLIMGALESLPKTYDVDVSGCKSRMNIGFSPAVPLTLLPGMSTIVTQTVSVTREVCRSGSFTCEFRYTEGGADLPTTTVEIVNVNGCPGRG